MSDSIGGAADTNSNHPPQHQSRPTADREAQTTTTTTSAEGADAATRRMNGLNNRVDDAVDEARIVACDYIRYRLRRAGFTWPDCPTTDLPAAAADLPRYCLVMRTLGDEFEHRYAEAFHDMSTTLQITPYTAYPTFLNVGDELFRGRGGGGGGGDHANNGFEITWGKIVALHAFAAALAVQCVDKEMPQVVNTIADGLTLYTRTYLAAWIAAHGGWNGFVQFHDRADGEDRWSSFKKVMTGVGVAFGAVGVATLARMLVSRP